MFCCNLIAPESFWWFFDIPGGKGASKHWFAFWKNRGTILTPLGALPDLEGDKAPLFGCFWSGIQKLGAFFAVHFAALRWNLAACCVFGLCDSEGSHSDLLLAPGFLRPPGCCGPTPLWAQHPPRRTSSLGSGTVRWTTQILLKIQGLGELLLRFG